MDAIRSPHAPDPDPDAPTPADLDDAVDVRIENGDFSNTRALSSPRFAASSSTCAG